MNPWRVFSAVLVFLVCIAVGAFGGCTAGVMTALSMETNPNAQNVLWVMIALGAAAGAVGGGALAWSILKKPRE